MKSLNIGTFNVRGLRDETKKDNLAADLANYNLDVVCLQETKISEGADCNIRDSRLIALKSTNKHHGNGFIVSSKWKENIHRVWKFSDRIAVLQLTTKAPEYTSTHLGSSKINISRKICYQSKLITRKPRKKKIAANYVSQHISDAKLIIRKTPTQPTSQLNTQKTRNDKLRMRISKTKPRNIITIINVYAPQATAIDDTDAFYEELDAAKKKIDKERTSGVLLICGDFNASVGKAIGTSADPSLGSYSRGTRNRSGQALIDFCNRSDLFATNTAFQHSARHMTTWESVRTIRPSGSVLRLFKQIDYILCERKQKRLLQDARSYAGTLTASDHRLVKTVIQIDPAVVFKQRSPANEVKHFNVALLRDHAVQEQYKTDIRANLQSIGNGDDGVAVQQHWDSVASTVKSSAERVLGFAKRTRQKKRTHNPNIAALSTKQKNIRLQIATCTDPDRVARLRNERNQVLKQIKRDVRADREKLIDETVNDIERLPDHTKIFKAVREINRTAFVNPVVNDGNDKMITNPQLMYDQVNAHFNNHFFDPSLPTLPAFIGDPSPLGKPITVAEVAKAAKKLNNNRAPGIDRISAELVKYGPVELHSCICDILNEALQKHQDLELGCGILIALQKPGKDRGPVKNLRPVILLLIIRKLLSNIVLERIRPQYEQYISPTQSAYRSNRSTADIVWAHRFMITKSMTWPITLYITGLDLSAAFDTIRRDELMTILAGIVGSDELRMIRLLLSNTTLEVRMKEATTNPFASNVGSPQGDAISGVLFNIYLEDALRRVRAKLNADTPSTEHSYARPRLSMPKELCYADDSDYPTLSTSHRDRILDATYEILPQRNLKVNQDKTEHTVVQQSGNTQWRKVRKLGSLLGDSEDIAKRKQLAIAGMRRLNDVWVRKDRTSLRKRLGLYKQLVKPLLTYNCGTWGLSKVDEQKLDTFHRRQLRRILGISWPHRISNKRLYEMTDDTPVSLFVTQQRWRLFGHILRSHPESPANEAMKYFFEPVTMIERDGTRSFTQAHKRVPRISLVGTIDRDLKRAAMQYPNNAIRRFQNAADLQFYTAYAADRSNWRNLTELIIEAAEDDVPQ